MPASSRSTLLLLVRHGLTPTTGVELYGRRPGVHLSEAGLQQAQQAAERISALGKRIAAVYASPLERAQQTAAPIAEAVDRLVQTHEGLNEADVGRWTGRKLSQLRKLAAWSQVQRYPSGFGFPDGETMRQMQARIAAATSELVGRHRGSVVVAVSHADPIRALVADAMGTHLDLFQRVSVSPCSVTAILYSAEGPMVLATNSTSNLAALSPA